MNNKPVAIVQSIDSFVASLSDRLQPVLKDTCSIGQIRSATQKSTQGISGYVLFSPHRNPEEEEIDATLFIQLGENIAKISADICWSDGEMISDFGEFRVEYSSLDDLSRKIESIYPQIEENMFSKMVELVKSALPPKYRRE